MSTARVFHTELFDTVLIANRGEIALRIARACRELGLRVVAVYSEADADSAVVTAADQAVCIGPAPAKHSYLNIPAIIEAALRTGAQAVHPGYGFLSENPDFAEVCEASGLVFVGPPAPIMQQLGDKTAARSLMAEAEVPLLPGSLHPLNDVEEARWLANGVGYPVIVKAAAGGGGRGMQIVRDSEEFAGKFIEARATALTLFGDPRVYVEKYLSPARHVEIQILCDQHGNTVHLGERDCSVQRRHQKLIEETPASGLPTDLLDRMSDAAVRGALAAGYVGAGTFEFLVGPDGGFYFMEVNGRIQVEHPVTEMAYGIDLVQEQLRIAGGTPLTVKQEDVQRRGAAIECRINAEDPARGFIPTPGLVTEFVLPGGPFVRVDTHVRSGFRISASYDSLLAKLIVWAPDRGQAISRMSRALDEFCVSGPGISTTVEFLRRIIQTPSFRMGTHNTSLIAEIQEEE